MTKQELIRIIEEKIENIYQAEKGIINYWYEAGLEDAYKDIKNLLLSEVLKDENLRTIENN